MRFLLAYFWAAVVLLSSGVRAQTYQEYNALLNLPAGVGLDYWLYFE